MSAKNREKRQRNKNRQGDGGCDGCDHFQCPTPDCLSKLLECAKADDDGNAYIVIGTEPAVRKLQHSEVADYGVDIFACERVLACLGPLHAGINTRMHDLQDIAIFKAPDQSWELRRLFMLIKYITGEMTEVPELEDLADWKPVGAAETKKILRAADERMRRDGVPRGAALDAQ